MPERCKADLLRQACSVHYFSNSVPKMSEITGRGNPRSTYPATIRIVAHDDEWTSFWRSIQPRGKVRKQQFPGFSAPQFYGGLVAPFAGVLLADSWTKEERE